MRKCPNCGAVVQDNTNPCPSCNYTFEELKDPGSFKTAVASLGLVFGLQIIPLLIMDSAGVDVYGLIGCPFYILLNLIVATLAVRGRTLHPTTSDYVWQFIIGLFPIIFYVNYFYAGKHLARRYMT